jgi:hypothetical protein
MKKLVFLSLIFITLFACKKTKFSPEGPTDVRVENLSDLPWVEVIVNTSGGIDTLGNIAAHDTSSYFRFEKAFPKAEITATINGEKYTTGTVNYVGMTYIGQAKITYQAYISSIPNKTLTISNCSLDAPLDDTPGK